MSPLLAATWLAACSGPTPPTGTPATADTSVVPQRDCTTVAPQGTVAVTDVVDITVPPRAGLSLVSAAAADLDGDGAVNLAVYDGSGTEVIPGPLPAEVTLGNPTHPQRGFLAAAADLDADGIDDLLVFSSDSYEIDFDHRGVVHLITASGAHATFHGDATTDQVGRSTASGDLDGDGAADLVIGNQQALTVFHGPVAAGTRDVNGADVRLVHEFVDDLGVADLTGDGVADLLWVSASAGAGITEGPVDGASPEHAVGWTDRTKRTLQAAGDLDGDGQDDAVLCGRDSTLGLAECLVYRGPLTADLAAADADATLTAGANLGFGSSRDLDLDGLAELVLADAWDGTAYPGAGAVWVFDAPAGQLTPDDATTTVQGTFGDWDETCYGTTPYYGGAACQDVARGQGLSGGSWAGDLDGDGTGELLLMSRHTVDDDHAGPLYLVGGFCL